MSRLEDSPHTQLLTTLVQSFHSLFEHKEGIGLSVSVVSFSSSSLDLLGGVLDSARHGWGLGYLLEWNTFNTCVSSSCLLG